MLAGAYICFVTALGIAGVKTEFPRIDSWLARRLVRLAGFDGSGNLPDACCWKFTGRASKARSPAPLYDSRLVGLLAQPESLFTTAAQALDYQFGFKVSETWFFQLLQQSLPVLFLAQLAALLLSTCVVFIDPGEQGILEHFGRLAARPFILEPGGHLLWPWPIDKVHRYRTGQIQTFEVGFTSRRTKPGGQDAFCGAWRIHGTEVNFLVGNRGPATVTNQTANGSDLLKWRRWA